MKSPAIQEVYDIWRWYKDGQLTLFLDGKPLTAKVVKIIRTFENGYNAGIEAKRDETKHG